MSNIYKDRTYLNNNASWHEEDSQWKASQIEKIIKLNSLFPKKICEVGCGAGEILACLQKHNNDIVYYGYEI